MIFFFFICTEVKDWWGVRNEAPLSCFYKLDRTAETLQSVSWAQECGTTRWHSWRTQTPPTHTSSLFTVFHCLLSLSPSLHTSPQTLPRPQHVSNISVFEVVITFVVLISTQYIKNNQLIIIWFISVTKRQIQNIWLEYSLTLH